ncbi:hypothetical protein A2U01_0084185, partial [Trifolium medium]|nr:hypothetical protein [Trifolium medium]
CLAQLDHPGHVELNLHHNKLSVVMQVILSSTLSSTMQVVQTSD